MIGDRVRRRIGNDTSYHSFHYPAADHVSSAGREV